MKRGRPANKKPTSPPKKKESRHPPNRYRDTAKILINQLKYDSYTIPWASIASATVIKPAMLAPLT